VYVGSIDEPGSAPRLVMESGSSAKYSDGYLVFLRDNALVAQQFDPVQLTLSGEPRIVADQVELSGVASASFGFSDTGALVYQTATDGSQLVWVDRQGRHLESIGEPGRYGDLELSPDGRQVAVSILNAATNTRDIWTVDLARGVRTRITTDRAEDVAPVWSADGTRIVFASNRTGHFELYQKSATGPSDDQLIDGVMGESYPSSWAPDGVLLFWTFIGRDIGVMRLVDKGPERWLDGASQATLSRDARWVLYVSPETGRPEVFVTSYPSHAWRTQVSTAGGVGPRWRADGREMYYVARDNKLMAASITPRGARLEIGEAHPLFEVRPVSRGSFYAPAPDGERFLINALSDPGAAASLTLVQNWSAAVQP
jgi:dipeptidyl aminopeptidase/acylaminoacyl peptidase